MGPAQCLLGAFQGPLLIDNVEWPIGGTGSHTITWCIVRHFNSLLILRRLGLMRYFGKDGKGVAVCRMCISELQVYGKTCLLKEKIGIKKLHLLQIPTFLVSAKKLEKVGIECDTNF